MELGLYVHIPYCVRKCLYCDFCSYPGRIGTADAYVDAVLAEAERAAEKLSGRSVTTLFIGGGTPSLLPATLMKRLLTGLHTVLPFTPSAECSCEMNPGTVTAEWLDTLLEGGINRVSVGVQSLNDALLSRIGRIHSAEDALNSVRMLKNAGFSNINCDVMFALPGQTVGDLRDTLTVLLQTGITHLSCYSLIPEEGTPLGDAILAGRVQVPGEQTEREMYALCQQETARRGMRQYEISNFAYPGYECRHNVSCWRREEYIGLGCAAAGFMGNKRYKNPEGLDDYLNGMPPEITEVAPREAAFESLMLGLRMTEGVSEALFRHQHGMTLEEAYGEKLRSLVSRSLAVWQDGYFRLTPRGMEIQNSVLVELMDY